MAKEIAISKHYMHGDLLQSIQRSISKLGKTIETITIEDLAPVDEFHIGGRQATENLLNQLGFLDQNHILDVGCGLGGAARFAAHRYNNQVTGIDLTEEFIETGNALCAWVNLDKKVTLQQGNATAMPFQDESFDGGYMLHVGMNVEDKERLFKEVFRVLRRGSAFGIYDIMRVNDGALTLPVPWATDESTSSLATAEQYQYVLNRTGFNVSKKTDRRDFALEFFKKLGEKADAAGDPPPLGLHTLMKESTSTKINNMVDSIKAGYLAPVEIIAHRL